MNRTRGLEIFSLALSQLSYRSLLRFLWYYKTIFNILTFTFTNSKEEALTKDWIPSTINHKSIVPMLHCTYLYTHSPQIHLDSTMAVYKQTPTQQHAIICLPKNKNNLNYPITRITPLKTLLLILDQHIVHQRIGHFSQCNWCFPTLTLPFLLPWPSTPTISMHSPNWCFYHHWLLRCPSPFRNSFPWRKLNNASKVRIILPPYCISFTTECLSIVACTSVRLP